jgi:DNA-binding CsgD family transcriptional regulator
MNMFMEERHLAVRSASFEPLGSLTRRETDVLQWVTEGKTNAEIAIILGMSPRTVQKHLEHIFEKLGVETRTAAATWALVRIPFQIS